jgi:hypothetical protein
MRHSLVSLKNPWDCRGRTCGTCSAWRSTVFPMERAAMGIITYPSSGGSPSGIPGHWRCSLTCRGALASAHSLQHRPAELLSSCHRRGPPQEDCPCGFPEHNRFGPAGRYVQAKGMRQSRLRRSWIRMARTGAVERRHSCPVFHGWLDVGTGFSPSGSLFRGAA